MGVLIPKTTIKVTHKTPEFRGTGRDNDMSNKRILDFFYLTFKWSSFAVYTSVLPTIN